LVKTFVDLFEVLVEVGERVEGSHEFSRNSHERSFEGLHDQRSVY
jgi:hypothetical protein